MANMTVSNSALGVTACWTAAARAAETARADALFSDPWAAALAGESGAAWLAQRTPGSYSPMIIRTHFFDGFLQRAAGLAGIRQVVLLAAGLDTRAFRLDWPEGTVLFELDQPDVLAYKDRVLAEAGAQPKCRRVPVGVDLTADWEDALASQGFDPLRPSVWLLEGFLFYISNESTSRLLDGVTRMASPSSAAGFDVVNSITLTSPMTKAWIDMQASSGAPWVGWMDDPVGFMAQRGWQTSLTQPGAPDAHYNRWPLPVIPVSMPGMPHNWYVTAHRESPV